MNDSKRLKDPIYGYVDVPIDYIRDIIDTPVFQRLRRIIQTSYSPLYASSLHNRFIHSLGVFHLGKIAGKTLTREAKEKVLEDELTIDVDCLNRIFLLACLLHDVGHAPFSHTGEEYYLEVTSSKYVALYKTLCETVDSESFKFDIPEDSKAAAPHEIMSAIIGLRNFSFFFTSTQEKEFFVRCITGYKYSKDGIEESLRNCFIVLLNSKVIDVDRLDYLIRDAFFTGFSTVNIDYERLLSSLTLIRRADKQGNQEEVRYELAYHKGAISVIENVVYAHDAERKWIQSHPIILYDIYIIQHIISKLNAKYSLGNARLFSEESLGEDGHELREDGHELDRSIKVSLLCDDDIIYLMKDLEQDTLSKEYFNRRKRRHPVWKSESEYRALVLDIVGEGSLLDKLENALSATENYLRKQSVDWVINDKIIKKIETELEEIEKSDSATMEKNRTAQLITKKRILTLMHTLRAYAGQQKIPCNYVILEASQFSSGFGRPDFSNLNIVFSAENIKKFSKIVTSLSGNQKPRDRFFYLYYEQIPGIDVDKNELCKALFKAFM